MVCLMPSTALVNPQILLTREDVARSFSARVRLSPIVLAVRRANPRFHFVQFISPKVVQLVYLGDDGLPVCHWNCRVPYGLSDAFPGSMAEFEGFCEGLGFYDEYPFSLINLRCVF